MWRLLLEHELNKFLYLAEMANISFTMQLNTKGLTLFISCFADSARAFLRDLSHRIAEFLARADKPEHAGRLHADFELLKQKKRQTLDKTIKGDPFRFAQNSKTNVFQTNIFSTIDLADELARLTFEDYLPFHAHVLDSFCFDGLISGNCDRADSLQMHEALFSTLRGRAFRPLASYNAS